MAKGRGHDERRSRDSCTPRVALIGLLLLACAAPPAPDPWTLWTIDTLFARGDPATVPAAATLRLLSPPYAETTVTQTSSNNGLTVFPAFSEGQTAAYVTTEVWQNFDEVWVQPLYIPLGGPSGSRPVFGVDASTRFYSPYWQIWFYTPPQGAVFKSAKEVLDSGVALTPGPGKFCAITRDAGLLPAMPQGADHWVRRLSGEPVIYDPATQPRPSMNNAAYVDGELVWFIDLGTNRFTWSDALIVDETPLFTFTRSDGTPLDLPKVGGTGPWRHPSCDGHGNCLGVVGGKPQFGALWRIWTVSLPPASQAPSLDVYVPQAQPQLQAYVRAMGFAATPPARDDSQYTLRVALDGKSCFTSGNLARCQWLDSQNAIQDLIPDWRAYETGTLVSCPLVLFNGKAIGP